MLIRCAQKAQRSSGGITCSLKVAQAIQIRCTGVKLRNEVGIVRLQIVESTSQHVQVLHGGLDLPLTGAPEIDSLAHQQSILRPGVLFVGTGLDGGHLLVNLVLQLEVQAEVGGNLGVAPPVGILLIEEGLLGVEARARPAFPPKGGPVGIEVGLGGLDTSLADSAILVLELVGLDHVFEKVVGGEVELGRYCGHGVFGRPKKQAHRRVEQFELFVIILVP